MVAFQRKSRLSQPEDDVLAEAVRLPGAGRSGQPPRALVQDGGRSFRSHLEGCGHSRAGLRQPCPKAGPLCRRLGSGDRKSVVKGKSVSVREDLGGRRISKKKSQSINYYNPKRSTHIK